MRCSDFRGSVLFVSAYLNSKDASAAAGAGAIVVPWAFSEVSTTFGHPIQRVASLFVTEYPVAFTSFFLNAGDHI